MAERAWKNFLCLMILAEQRCFSGAPLVLGQQWHCQVVEDNHRWRDLSFEAHQAETHNPEQPGCRMVAELAEDHCLWAQCNHTSLVLDILQLPDSQQEDNHQRHEEQLALEPEERHLEELAERGLMGALVWVLGALRVGDPEIVVLDHMQSDDFTIVTLYRTDRFVSPEEVWVCEAH